MSRKVTRSAIQSVHRLNEVFCRPKMTDEEAAAHFAALPDFRPDGLQFEESQEYWRRINTFNGEHE